MFDKIIFKLNKIYYILRYRNVKFGKKINFRKNFSIRISKNAVLKIGDGCFFNNYNSINVKGNVEIGDDCIFGEGVKIYDHNHRFNIREKNIKDQGYSVGNVIIGRNCWIGSNVCILKGAKIGDNVVIAAGSIIDFEIPSNSVYKNINKYVIEEIKYKEVNK